MKVNNHSLHSLKVSNSSSCYSLLGEGRGHG